MMQCAYDCALRDEFSAVSYRRCAGPIGWEPGLKNCGRRGCEHRLLLTCQSVVVPVFDSRDGSLSGNKGGGGLIGQTETLAICKASLRAEVSRGKVS